MFLLLSTPVAGFSITKHNTMLNSINNSPAQAKNELQSIKSPVMLRVLSGESFKIATDILPKVYRLDCEAAGYYTLTCGGHVLCRCEIGQIFPQGFVVRLNLLGESRNISVLAKNIRMIKDYEGGALC